MQNHRWTYEDYVKANPDKKFSRFDYLHAISTQLDFQHELYLTFAELFHPKFLVIDNEIFVEELFSQEEYDKYREQGRTTASIQPWMNLIEITALFNFIEPDAARKIADLICESWNCKIKTEFGFDAASAQIKIEDDFDEIYVTIGKFKNDLTYE
ncbi:hypothetical protein [Cupriavidus sp. SW-Y-13]|uniref:hypothetical protein n=1 Tax=Cupriavidus sp. SW-Y-13 TaxID=2653854 RepID=UPI0013662558|nr:hypothetical protein [Cupriavidus sp. SW-Y-13]MWL88867.1 hypothetical protein [Cupriavidus sp. SW-Y-13]